MDYSLEQIAKMIDHSLLQPVLTNDQLEAGLLIAIESQVASVCIKPYYLERCSEVLAGTGIASSTVIGFPHGSNTTDVKLREIEVALADGGKELDCVVNIGKVLGRSWKYVERELERMTRCVHQANAKIKVIFENCYLSDGDKIMLCKLCGQIGVDWVKTSTGYGSGGATFEDIALMRQHSPPEVQVKAAGGIRSLDALLEARRLGATRVGATRTVEILEACRQQLRHPS